jgi:histone-binding protein RBBP4
MPQSSNLIATKTTSGEVHLFDFFKHPSKHQTAHEAEKVSAKPNIRLVGHSQEGYGLAWNPGQAGLLLSGSDDGAICLWDVAGPTRAQEENIMEPITKIKDAHGGKVVEDVAWSHF